MKTLWLSHGFLQGQRRFWLVVLSLWSCCSVAAIPVQSDEALYQYRMQYDETVESVAWQRLRPEIPWTRLLDYNPHLDPFAAEAGRLLAIPVSWLRHTDETVISEAVQGRVQVRRKHAQSIQPLAVNTTLQPGDEVATQQGNATLRFADGSRIMLSPDTHLVLTRMARFADTGMTDLRFKLFKGRVLNEVSPRKRPAGHYEISSGNLRVQVAGTVFAMATDANRSQLEVFEGEVRVYRGSDELRLQTGQGLRTGSGFLIPEALPGTPEVDLPPTLKSLPANLDWAPVIGADHYQLELLRADNGALIQKQRLTQSQTKLEGLNNGAYTLRIYGVSEDGLRGPAVQQNFSVSLTATPARLVYPDAGARTLRAFPDFNWETDHPGMLASLEISRSADFSELVSRTRFAAVSKASPETALTSGQYFWRVVTLLGGNSYAASTGREVLISQQLPRTRIISVNFRDSIARVFWQKIPEAHAYLLQVSDDETFARVLQELQMTVPSARLELDRLRTWYVRVKPLGHALAMSEFSAAEAIRLPEANP